MQVAAAIPDAMLPGTAGSHQPPPAPRSPQQSTPNDGTRIAPYLDALTGCGHPVTPQARRGLQRDTRRRTYLAMWTADQVNLESAVLNGSLHGNLPCQRYRR